MWWLWRMDGYGFLYAVPVFTLWIVWHGYWADRRRDMAHPRWFHSAFAVEVPVRIAIALGFYTIFRWLVALNPPPWNPAIIWDHVSLSWVNTVVLKHIVTAYLLLLAAHVTLSISPVRRFFGLRRLPAEKWVGAIYAGALLMGFLLWWGDALVDYLAFNPRGKTFWDVLIFDVALHDFVMRNMYILVALIAGGFIARFLRERKQAQDRVAHLNRVLRAIRNVNQLIVREKDRAQLIQGVCESLTETHGYYNAWIVLFDKAGEVTASAQFGLDKHFLSLLAKLRRDEVPPCGAEALTQEAVVVIPDPTTACVGCPLAARYVGRGGMTVRLAHGGHIYGLLAVSIPADFVRDEEEQALVHEVAGDVAFALYNLELEAARAQAEAALRESEEKFKHMFEHVPIGLSMTSTTGPVQANRAFYEMLGCEKHSATLQWQEITHPEDVEKSQAVIDALLTGEEDSARFTKRYVHKDGSIVWAEVSTSIRRDAEGEARYFMTAVQDITERKQAEQALRESERRFRIVLANLPGGLFAHDLDGHLLLVNELAAKNTGYTQDELLNMTVADIDPGSVTRDDRAHLWHQLDEGETLSLQATHIRKDGSQYPVEVHLSNIMLKGEPVILGIALDITQRKQAEAALRESEERFRLTFHTSPDAININRLEDGLYVDINEGFTQLTGYTREDVIGKTSLEINIWHDPADRQELVRGLREKGYYKNLEAQFRRKDGSTTTALMSASVISLQGTPHIISVTKDISARKRAEEDRARLAAQVREQARQMEQILATVPTGVLLLDAEWRILHANPTAEDDLAKLADAEVGDVLIQLGERPLAELLTSPSTRGLWHEVQADSNTFEVIARSMPTSTSADEDDAAEQWVLVINDVTREREIRAQLQQQERLAAVGQLAAGIAHDFNNIMAVVVLYAQLGLRTPNLPPKIGERLQIISQQAKRATDLIQQILDFSRRAMLERRPLDLLPLLKEQVKLLERTLPEHIEIELAYEPEEYIIHADPTRMQQMIMNLAVNARDAMPEGGALRIKLEQITLTPDQTPPLVEMEPGTWHRLTVADTGAGIPPEALLHIFEPFFTTKEPGKGSGLGLPQVHGIVGLHGGHIDVETQIGKGTTFTIYFPALVKKPTEELMEDTSEMIRGRGETILVVEDEATVRAALAETLEQLGYRVLPAANGQEALNILALHADKIALVLSDFVMPSMGGRALFGAMRQRGYDLPMVLLSGHPLENELREMQEQGLAGWMLKPPHIEQLAKVLARVLKDQDDGKQ
ncbi:MAG: PAS domain S-box protein [Anaerolineales bacterium]